MKHTVVTTLAVFFSWLLSQQAAAQNTDYYTKAKKCLFDAKIDSALTYIDMQLANPADTTNYTRLIESLLLRSQIMGNLTFFEPAMDNAIQSYDLSRKHNLNNLEATSLLSIGKVHFLMYNDSVAEVYMLRAKETAQKYKLDKELMTVNNSLAQLYSALERNDELLELVTQSLAMARKLNDTANLVQGLSLQAVYYTNLNRHKNPVVQEYQLKNKQYLDEALKLAEAYNSSMLTQGVYMQLIRYYRNDRNFEEALNCVNRVIGMCEPNHYSVLIQMYDHLVAIYTQLGNKEMAINSHQRFYDLMRRQSDYNLHRSLQEMQVQHNVREKEHEIERQQVKIKQTLLQRRLVSVAAVFALMLSGMYYYMYRIRRMRNKELHLVNAAKDKLFSIISHDLKSPVAAQKMMVENMLKNLDVYDKPRMMQCLQSFHHSTETQLELLQNLFNWARMQTGQMQYTPVRFDMGELITEVVEIFELPAQNKGIAIRTDVPEGCIVQADRLMIHTVLRNLINNAVKFTKTGGEVVLSVSCCNESAQVSVKDNGTGMTSEQINKLFIVGESLSTTGTHGEKGSGLGLIICKELLERNGSEIKVRSVPNVGTIIDFELMK